MCKRRFRLFGAAAATVGLLGWGFGATTQAAETLVSPLGATASATYQTNTPLQAVDGNTGTMWSAGGFAPQWIVVDTSGSRNLSHVELLVSQSPAGTTTHNVYTSADGASYSLVATLTGSTSDGQWLSAALNRVGRYVKIETTASPSWVGWYEIKVYQTAPSGTISANPATCTIPTGQTTCTTQLSWTASNLSGTYARVWVASAPPSDQGKVGAWVDEWPGHNTVSVSWIQAGTYRFELRDGTTSAGTLLGSVSVMGTASSNPPPTVSLDSPTNGQSFGAGASITLSATASDSNGTVTKVEFYNGATLLATFTAPPYKYIWPEVAAGSYSLTAKATDNGGAVTTSTPSNVTVSAPNVSGKLPPLPASSVTARTGSNPGAAFDGTTTTIWNAGALPQCPGDGFCTWIEADLGKTYNVTRLKLTPSYWDGDATGPITVKIYGGPTPAPATLLRTMTRDVTSGASFGITFSPNASIRYVRVDVTNSASWVGWSEIEVYQDPHPSLAHVAYMGYFGTAIDSNTIGTIASDRIAATADHANLSWIFPDANMIQLILEGRQYGMKSIVNVNWQFFSFGGVAGARTCALNPNWVGQWDAMATALTPYIGDIAAFYPVDEPNLYNCSGKDVQTAIDAIHQRFPGTPVAAIYSVENELPPYTPNDARPAIGGYDWVGIDCYNNGQFTCGSTVVTSYLDAYDRMADQLTPTQRTMLIPQAAVPVAPPTVMNTAVDAISKPGGEADLYLGLAGADARIVAVVPFRYQNTTDGDGVTGTVTWYGTENFSSMRAKFASIGSAITGRSGSSINVALAANGGVASASSTYSAGYPVTAINNGDRAGLNWGSSGGWNDATSNAFPDWVQVNFSGSKTIDHIVLYTLQDNYGAPVQPTDTMTFSSYGVTAFNVQAWNGTAWVTLGAVSGNNLVKRTVSFTATTTDRIRVNITNALASYSRIVELEAWGH